MQKFLSPLLLLVLLSAHVLGCRHEDQITRYRTPKEQTFSATAAATAQEMLVALTVRNGQVYFFKAVGPVDQMERCRKPVRKFLQELRFPADGPPTWKLPQGWSQSGGAGMRLATLSIGDPPIELVISSLRQTNSDWQAYMVSNLNRWRGQMGLAPLAASVANQSFETIVADGQEIFLAQIAGERTETRPRSSIAPRSSAASPSRPSVGFDTASVKGVPPTDWKAGPVTGMRKACFRVNRGEKSLEVTVIPAGGDLLANVNRWRGQIGLTPISTEQLQKDAQDISAGKVTGKYVSLLGSEQAILAAIFPTRGGGSWFVKMRGDRTLTEKETATFKSFVNTLRFGPTFQ